MEETLEVAADGAAEVAAEEAAEEREHPYADVIERHRRPVPGANPCGIDVMQLKPEDFMQVKNEVDKMESAAVNIDYDMIIEVAEKILQTKSKDLMTASYLSLALLRANGCDGLARGLVTLQTIGETFWDGLHPEKEKRRINALGWIAKKMQDWLQQRLQDSIRPSEEERIPLEAAMEALEGLQALTSEKMDEGPAWSGLRSALKETVRYLPKPVEQAPPPPPPSAAPAEAAPVQAAAPRPATPSAAAPAASASAAGAPVAVGGLSSYSDAQTALFKIVGFLRGQDKTDPVPYLVVRGLWWGRLRKEPPQTGGTTALEGPRSQQRDVLENLLNSGSYDVLVEACEAQFQQFPFWLDLQRLVTSAMEALGPAYQDVRTAILCETAAFLARLPGMTKLSFKDGTPFANPMTHEWLETTVAPLLGSGEGGGGAAGQGGNSHIAEQFNEARQKLGSGDLAGALQLMRAGRGEDVSQADRFRRRLYEAMLCLRGGQPMLARPMLESLDATIEKFALPSWDPGLTLEVWSNLYQCYNALAKAPNTPNKPAVLEQAGEVLGKIAGLDPSYALNVQGG